MTGVLAAYHFLYAHLITMYIYFLSKLISFLFFLPIQFYQFSVSHPSLIITAIKATFVSYFTTLSDFENTVISLRDHSYISVRNYRKKILL